MGYCCGHNRSGWRHFIYITCSRIRSYRHIIKPLELSHLFQKKIFSLVLLGGFAGLLYIYQTYNPASVYFPKCPFHYFTGFYCPGCGSQRAVHALLNLKLAKAFSYNALACIFIIAFLFDLLCEVFGEKNIRPYYLLRDRRYAALISLIIIFAFTIARNLPLAPFNVLAP